MGTSSISIASSDVHVHILGEDGRGTLDWNGTGTIHVVGTKPTQ